MKKWLINGFLPMWAKQTVLEDNRQMARQIRALRGENQELKAYIRGLESGMRAGKRIQIYNRGGE
ncbi:MAG: hypothetical protein IJO04_04735 [Oscillospiraceae bacterium]|nr:hypothetical protein [Oscillospiraceae bacterium]